MNFNRHGLTSNLRRIVEKHTSFNMDGPNNRKITMQDLAEFYLQLGGCIFSPQEKENEEAVDEEASR